MTRMIPPFIHKDIKSNAEKRIFDLIEAQDFSEEWVCIHSLGLSSHSYKVEGEIDFLLIGEQGIFCLEVKGGRVSRKDGLWIFEDKYGNKNTKQESPFRQASSALYSLISKLEIQNLFSKRNHLFGYGTIFPDIHFDIESPEWDRNIIYDLSDRHKPFKQYLFRLIEYWNKKAGGKLKLSVRETDAIVNYLRGNFEVVPSLGNRIGQLEDHILILTENQYKALDRMHRNKRMFFCGTAGTGKTLLALEKARRSVLEDKRVLFLCFNRILGSMLNQKSSTFGNSTMITANSIHKYFHDVIMKTSYANEFQRALHENRSDSIFKHEYPDFYIKALRELDEKYDCLIIDEGQDLLCFEYFIPLDYVLKGGLETGHWAVFYDNNNQGKLYSNFDEMLIQNLMEFGAGEYWLDTNCRNTQQIATQTSVVSSFHVETSLITNGEKVKYYWYLNNFELINVIQDILLDLLSKGIVPSDITLLYPSIDYEEILSRVNIPCNMMKMEYENVSNWPSNCVSYSSVQAYKGMENKVIIYFGIDDLQGDWINTVNYVGMSRARELLLIIMQTKLKDAYRIKSIEYLEREGNK